MIYFAIAMLCAGCLATPSLGFSAANEQLFPGFVASEKLNQAELIIKLSKAIESENLTDVINALYETKHKNSTVVHHDVTVHALIPENDIGLEDCSVDALERRLALYNKVRPVDEHEKGIQYAVAAYCVATLHGAISYCVQHEEEVVAGGINDKEWMEGLKLAYSWDVSIKFKPFWVKLGLDGSYAVDYLDDPEFFETISRIVADTAK
jgi:hypothetical protein